MIGVKLYSINYSILGVEIGDIWEDHERRLESKYGTNWHGSHYIIGYTGVKFYIGSRTYVYDMPEGEVYAIEVSF